MKAKIIRKEDVADLLDKFIEEYELFAPVKRDNLVVFDRIHSGNEAFLDYTNTTKSAKEILFPQAETLFSYVATDGGASIETPPSEESPRLLFGVRPCDARSFVLLDEVFDGEKYKDVYYLNRRANMAVVAIGCVRPRSTCFCTSVGGAPCSAEGSDLLLIDVGDDYVVQVVSDKGARLLEGVGLEDAGEDEIALMWQAIRDAQAYMAPKLAMDGLKQKLDSMFEDPIWGPLTEKCLGCGVCTYLCPTCHCFDIVDEATDSAGQRIRLWDSCQFRQFTLQASGFNPRPTTKGRLRQRIMHKFSYFIDNYGHIGCVGCGRCVIECPVNLDTRDVLTDILMEKVAK
ncbi:4Fe-4S dicluster domain-containing protein [Chloroflexota bacterium]